MAKKLRFVLLAILFLLITLAYPCWSEPITNIKSLGRFPYEVQRVQLPTFHDNRLISSDDCEQTYGVMPCTNTVLGNGFLILVYAYCIFWAAKILTDGSEILLEILGPGIIGGLSLLIFISLPNAIIILGKSDLLLFFVGIIWNQHFLRATLLVWALLSFNSLLLQRLKVRKGQGCGSKFQTIQSMC